MGFFITLFFSLPVIAQENTKLPDTPTQASIDPGTTPDSLFYGLSRTWEKVDLFFTFDKTEKAKKGLTYATEKIAQVHAMLKKKDTKAAAKALKGYEDDIVTVYDAVTALQDENPEQDFKTQLETETALKAQQAMIQELQTQSETTLSGQVSEQDHITFEHSLNATIEHTRQTQIRIQEHKEKTRIKIKAKEGKSDQEIAALEHTMKKDNQGHKGEQEREQAASGSDASDAEENEHGVQEQQNSSQEGIVQPMHTAAHATVTLKTQDEEENETNDVSKETQHTSQLGISARTKGGTTRVRVEQGNVEKVFTLKETSRTGIVAAIATKLDLDPLAVDTALQLTVESNKSPKDEQKELKAQAHTQTHQDENEEKKATPQNHTDDGLSASGTVAGHGQVQASIG